MNYQNIRRKLKKEMNEKPNMKILLLWFFLSVAGVVIIKTIIRPKHLLLSEPFAFLQGTLPNFFAGAMFCVLAFIYYGALSRNKKSIQQRLFFAFMFSFTGLTVWEYIQFYMGYRIDYYDIAMTVFGNLITIILIILLRLK